MEMTLELPRFFRSLVKDGRVHLKLLMDVKFTESYIVVPFSSPKVMAKDFILFPLNNYLLMGIRQCIQHGYNLSSTELCSGVPAVIFSLIFALLYHMARNTLLRLALDLMTRGSAIIPEAL